RGQSRPARAQRRSGEPARARAAHPAGDHRRRTRSQSVPARGQRRDPGRHCRATGARAARPGRNLRRTAALEGRLQRMTLRLALACLLACALLPAPGRAQTAPPEAAQSSPATRNGLEIYARFRDGRADENCDDTIASPRWSKHFAAAPMRMARSDDDALALFGFVVDSLQASSLPTEYALIPFVESRYRP